VTVFIALLRAINVGGTGKLSMKELASMCAELGLNAVRTYIQSGNVVFRSSLSEESVRGKLEKALEEKMGKRIDVLVRSAAEMRQVLVANPFATEEPAKVAIFFMHTNVIKGVLDKVATAGGERIRVIGREVFIHYPNGMGQSKLKLPSAIGAATARNVNTVSKLVEMAEEV